MFDITTIVGLTGSFVLLLGAFIQDVEVSHPVKSKKNWLFLVGGLIMLSYSLLNYYNGGTIFFVILQIFINTSSIFMMANVDDRIDGTIMGLVGLGLVAYSISIFEGIETALFIVGLTILGIGFVLKGNNYKRELFLAFGGLSIAIFSYIQNDYIFLFLNSFFSLFSFYWAYRLAFR